MMSAALGIFGVVALAAKWNNKAARVPYVCHLTQLKLLFA